MTAAFGVAAMLAFWFPLGPLEWISTEVVKSTTVITFFALLLGAVSQYLIHLPRIQQKTGEWKWSALFLAELTLFISVVLLSGMTSGTTQWIIDWLQTPLALGASAMYGPFVYRAILRSVHVRSKSVGVMILIMVIVWVGYAPIFYTNIPGLYELGDYVNSQLAAGTAHGFTFVVSIVSVVTCIRVLMGRDKGYLGRN